MKKLKYGLVMSLVILAIVMSVMVVNRESNEKDSDENVKTERILSNESEAFNEEQFVTYLSSEGFNNNLENFVKNKENLSESLRTSDFDYTVKLIEIAHVDNYMFLSDIENVETHDRLSDEQYEALQDLKVAINEFDEGLEYLEEGILNYDTDKMIVGKVKFEQMNENFERFKEYFK